MKNKMLIVVLFVTGSLFSQNFQGKAIYKTHRKMDMKFDGHSDMSDAMQERMQEQMKRQFQKTFILEFNKNESVYREDKKLSAPSVMPNGGNMVMVIGGGGGSDIYYKNIKSKKYVNKTEIMGKRFLIKDKLPTYDWKLSSETKNIGVYTCYKATFSREEDQMTMNINEKGKMVESKVKKTIVTTAWYTPEIAISNGPGRFTGLPGLILEVKEGNMTIVCSEIIMNATVKLEIKEPTKGKVVTQTAYQKIMDKKTKEMMERFKSRKGKKGNNIEIRIGG